MSGRLPVQRLVKNCFFLSSLVIQKNSPVFLDREAGLRRLYEPEPSRQLCGRKGDRNGNRCRQGKGDERPFCAFRFFVNVDECRAAWVVKQGKQHHIKGGEPRPAVVEQKLFKRMQTIGFDERPRG